MCTVVKYNITATYNSTVGSSSKATPSVTTAAKGATVSFTIPTVTNYTYQGTRILNASTGAVYKTIAASATKSFTMPGYAVKIAPTYKRNDLTLLVANDKIKNLQMEKSYYDANAYNPEFGYIIGDDDDGIFYIQVKDSVVRSSRAQVNSTGTYAAKYYSQLEVYLGGSVWTTASGSSRTAYVGLVRSKSTLLHNTVSSPDYKASVNMTLTSNTTKTVTIDLNSTQSANNNYYIAVQYLTQNTRSTLNIRNIYLHGATFTSS